MAQATSYAALYPLMQPELPKCGTPVILQALQKAGRRFCEDTDAFQETLDLIKVVDYQRDYTLTHNYAAVIRKLMWCKLNGSVIPLSNVELWHDTLLRFALGAAPYDQTEKALFCGTSGVLATFVAVTAGSCTFSIAGETLDVTGMDFSGCADMDAVALVIQTAVRAAQGADDAVIEWNEKTLKFAIYSESDEVSYLTAGTAGTDISGAVYLNGLTGGTAALAAYIQARVAFLPTLATDTLPDWLLERYSTPILALAMSDLMARPGMPWTNKLRANQYALEYARGWNRGKSDAATEFKDVRQEMVP